MRIEHDSSFQINCSISSSGLFLRISIDANELCELNDDEDVMMTS